MSSTNPPPITNASQFSFQVDPLGNVYQQMEFPSGRLWIKVSEGRSRPMRVLMAGWPTNLDRSDWLAFGIQGLASNLTSPTGTSIANSSVASSSYLEQYVWDGGLGQGLSRFVIPSGTSFTSSFFTAQWPTLPFDFNILRFGIFASPIGQNATKGSSIELQVKAGIFATGEAYDWNGYPYKVYDSATGYIDVNTNSRANGAQIWRVPDQSFQACEVSWDLNSRIPTIQQGKKFFIKSYWNVPAVGTSVSIIGREHFEPGDGGLGCGDRSTPLFGTETFSAPDWSTTFDPTSTLLTGAGNKQT